MESFVGGVLAALIDPIVIIGGLLAGFAADRWRWMIGMAVTWAIVLGVIFAAISADLQTLESIVIRMLQFGLACIAIGAAAFLVKNWIRKYRAQDDAGEPPASGPDRPQ